MKTKKYSLSQRQGFTLLELMVTTAMMAVISTASVVLVRTAYTAWNRHEDDNSQRRAANAVLRHIGRKVRQATAVVDISPSTDLSGNLSLLMPNGELAVWEHNDGTKQVLYGIGTATDVLADEVDSLRFYGYKTTMAQTTEPGLVHCIQAVVGVNISRPSGTDTELFYGSALLRSW
jgi:prepilin-type N-terminal cleavage/methylation domain-containing protein